MTDPITRALELIQLQSAANEAGAVAEYIPQLSSVDPDLFGIALASMNGQVYSAGDAAHPFTIQSVSKPFVYALALADIGLEATLARVGAEPSGEAFNAISLEPGTGRPANPMVNAGAIVTTSLIQAPDARTRFARIRATLSDFAGRELGIDQSVYLSESKTGDRNRALAYLMRNAGSLTEDVGETLDIYFRQCALLVTACDLAVMVATLANGGVNPVTGRRVVDEVVAGHVLTVMSTCGMYNFSGEWLLRVGLPAKSGVSGALVAASPAQFGIGLFSPRLDERGNSVRGVEVCRELSNRFELHLMSPSGRSAPATYLEGNGTIFRSEAARSETEQALLEPVRERIVVRGLQGEINFACAENVLRSLSWLFEREEESSHWIVLDLHRVVRIHRAGLAMLQAMVADFTQRGSSVVVVDYEGRGLLNRVREFATLDDALRWSEDAALTADVR